MSILLKWQNKYIEKATPFQATIELTYQCNERCRHCYLATYHDYEEGRTPLSVDEWIDVLTKLKDAGVLYLVILGGEPLMYPGFWRILSAACERNFAVSVITNGTLIDEKAIENFKKLSIYQVTISLYSLKPETHDFLTRLKGSFVRTLNAIEALKTNNIPIGINCLLTRYNIDDYFELESWARSRSIPIAFDPIVTAKNNGGLESTYLRASSEQLTKFYERLVERGFLLAPTPFQEDDPICAAGRSKCAVNVFGDLLTCLEIRESLGSLKEHSFWDLWNGEKAKQIRNLKNRDIQGSPQCASSGFCEHCPGMALAETGSLIEAVPFLVELDRIKTQVFAKR